MATTPAPTLTCAQCGYVNEAERVYCHNCGTKLDRTVLPTAAEQKQETLGQTRKRVKKMTTPGGGIGGYISTLMSVLFWAAVVAALLLVFVIPPDNVPKTAAGELPRMISSELMEATASPQPRQLQFSEDDVNAALKGKLKGKADAGVPGLQFQRAFVRFEPAVVRITAEQSLFGLPVYWSGDYELAVVDGQLRPRKTAAHFGRLAIHPVLLPYTGAVLRPIWTALKREQEQMNRLQSVAVQKGRIILVTKPAGRP
jgi:hypothetical protein